jgi:hypothetical protein
MRTVFAAHVPAASWSCLPGAMSTSAATNRPGVALGAVDGDNEATTPRADLCKRGSKAGDGATNSIAGDVAHAPRTD